MTISDDYLKKLRASLKTTEKAVSNMEVVKEIVDVTENKILIEVLNRSLLILNTRKLALSKKASEKLNLQSLNLQNIDFKKEPVGEVKSEIEVEKIENEIQETSTEDEEVDFFAATKMAFDNTRSFSLDDLNQEIKEQPEFIATKNEMNKVFERNLSKIRGFSISRTLMSLLNELSNKDPKVAAAYDIFANNMKEESKNSNITLEEYNRAMSLPEGYIPSKTNDSSNYIDQLAELIAKETLELEESKEMVFN